MNPLLPPPTPNSSKYIRRVQQQQPSLANQSQQLSSRAGSAKAQLAQPIQTVQLLLDSHLLMHKTLTQSLLSNEEVAQYIEQSGYSLEMFAFYMMKLYTHCASQVLSPSSAIFTTMLQELPTLRVNEEIFDFVCGIFTKKMSEHLNIPSQATRAFSTIFSASTKKLQPHSFVESLGGFEKVRSLTISLLENLCYESGVLAAFDQSLADEITDAVFHLLRSDQSLLVPAINKLKTERRLLQISNAEFYHVKVAAARVLQEGGLDNKIILALQAKILKQRGYFFESDDPSRRDAAFKTSFISSITKNKRVVGYLLDPSGHTLSQLFDILAGCLFRETRYADLIEFIEHRLKTSVREIPAIMLDELAKTIVDVQESSYHSSSSSITVVSSKKLHSSSSLLTAKDLQIKMQRLKQKAGILSFAFLNLPVGVSSKQLTEELVEWCSDAIITITLPSTAQETSILNAQFLAEYLQLVLSEHEQAFSIFDIDYAVTYHRIEDFDFTFNLWLTGIEVILGTRYSLDKQHLQSLISYLRLNSLLPL